MVKDVEGLQGIPAPEGVGEDDEEDEILPQVEGCRGPGAGPGGRGGAGPGQSRRRQRRRARAGTPPSRLERAGRARRRARAGP